MNFDSVFFISCFLPAAVLLYFLIPGLKAKNIVLLIVSLVFYCFSGFVSTLLLAALALVNYLLGLWLRKNQAKAALAIGVVVDVVFLGFFKYLSFLLTQVLGLPPLPITLAVPLGISFFTFKSISYLADIYREPESAAASFPDYLLFISFFPQIVTGPITRFRDFAPQLTGRVHSVQAAAAGLRRFIVGLGKKLILSGILGNLVDGIFGLPAGDLDARLAWTGAVGYCLQLYFDFSGYIDMANGLAMLFGFRPAENFNHPYCALSIGDFWRRWHISLSSWFKDYVYIPLGGNRKGRFRTGLNKCIVFLLCGIWHGASWTFVLWGIWHGLFSLLESTGVIPVEKLQKRRALGHIYTLLVVCIGFVMFRAGSVSQGLSFIGAMFTGFSFTAAGTVALYELFTLEALVILLAGSLLCLPVNRWLFSIPQLQKRRQLLSCAGCVVLLVFCLIALAAGGFAPSIYAGF